MHDDNILHCPVVQSPDRSSKRRKVSYVPPVTEFPFQGADDNEKGTVGCSNNVKPLVFVKLTGIVSYIDKKDEICSDKLHRFLSINDIGGDIYD